MSRGSTGLVVLQQEGETELVSSKQDAARAFTTRQQNLLARTKYFQMRFKH